MKNTLVRIILYSFLISLLCPAVTIAQTDNEGFCRQSIKESLVPIHPGIPGKQEFWNKYSKIFKHAPSFNNSNKSWLFSDPRTYCYTAFSFTDKKEYTFTANSPYEALTPIWEKIPNGNVYLRVEGISSDGNHIDLAGSRMFYKSPVFCPPYPEAKYSFQESLMKGLHFLYNQKHVKDWYFAGKPDHKEYSLYCYPAKIVGSVISGMVMYHRYFPKNDTSLVIACKAADYLMKTAEPVGSPLEYFPQIYEGDTFAAGRFGKEMILMEPAITGSTFLDLYKATKNHKYLDFATHIANTYIKNQLSNGTWYIRIYKETGTSVSEVLCIPIGIINFLSILSDEYHLDQYKPAIEAAVNWIMNNPVKTYDWTGQFEDYGAASPYENITKYEAAWFAQYLLDNKGENDSYVGMAKELIAFCEDQFVFWEKPDIYDNFGTLTNDWYAPCVTEQYLGYVPVDASSDQMILTFLKAYECLGDPIYREKAVALANAIVNAQDKDGKVPTFLLPTLTDFWQNCMVSSLTMLERLANFK